MGDIFVARQPILTKNKQVFAYELLFRSTKEETAYQAMDGVSATAQVLENSLLEIGLATLTDNHPAFVNFPVGMLMQPFMENLPTDLIVIEILETAVPTPEIIARCRELKAHGFQLALDDFVFSTQYRELIEIADYIKVDFRMTQGVERANLVRQLARPDLRLLAEKVETYAEYQEAVDDGYSLIQGYFFSKPKTVVRKTLHLSEQTAILFLQELAQDEIDFKRLEELIRRNVSLSYKILRFINSSYFGFRTEITSIRQALTLVGQKELYKWACLLVLTNLAVGKPSELIALALLRARFAELIAGTLVNNRASEFFIGGMFSLIDAFLDRPMAEVVVDLPVKQDVKDALLGVPNTLGLVLRLLDAYGRGEWEQGRRLGMALGLPESKLADDYYQAQLWSSNCMRMNQDGAAE